ncbi:MAG: exosortase system-associated protein, TIGR04073 family [Candidatus Omnitrophota bacterium]|nr:exosortase system-associated protein, TIGR04073 family [Candidatus Omnitrophota bacterium]
MLKRTVVLMIVALVVCSVTSVYAEDKNALTKLGRGLSNAVTGVVEIPKQIYLVSKEREPVSGITYGTAKGICYGLLRTGAGVYDSLAFAFPPYDKPILEPEYVFEGWGAEQK